MGGQLNLSESQIKKKCRSWNDELEPLSKVLIKLFISFQYCQIHLNFYTIIFRFYRSRVRHNAKQNSATFWSFMEPIVFGFWCHQKNLVTNIRICYILYVGSSYKKISITEATFNTLGICDAQLNAKIGFQT